MTFMEIFKHLSPRSDSVPSFSALLQSNSKEPLHARPPVQPSVR